MAPPLRLVGAPSRSHGDGPACTSVLGALKRGLNPRAGDLGIYVGGGRGRRSRNTPDELRTLQALAPIAEVVHGTPTRFSNPARFSFALGGKDRHPFPVPLKTYDEPISVLRRSLDAAKLGDDDNLQGFARLDRFVRTVEQDTATKVDF